MLLSIFTVDIVKSSIFMFIKRIFDSWQMRFALTTSIVKENSLDFLDLKGFVNTFFRPILTVAPLIYLTYFKVIMWTAP